MPIDKQSIMKQVKELAYVAIQNLTHRDDIQDDEEGFIKVMEIVTKVNSINAEFWINNKKEE